MTDQRPGQIPDQLFIESFKGDVVSADDALQLAEKLAADVAQWLQRGVCLLYTSPSPRDRG